MIHNADDARTRIELAMRQAQENVERSRELTRDLETMRVVGRSRDGSAEVVLSSSGALVDLRLDERLNSASLDEVRAAVLQANTDARSRAEEEIASVAGRHFGAGSKTVDQFEDHYTKMLRLPDAATGDDEGERR